MMAADDLAVTLAMHAARHLFERLEWLAGVTRLLMACAEAPRGLVDHAARLRVRRALLARTGMATIPQVFVAGQFVGGTTETIDAWKTGRLPAALLRAGVGYKSADADPWSFMPSWLQPRSA